MSNNFNQTSLYPVLRNLKSNRMVPKLNENGEVENIYLADL